jgi:hypothetical protein
MGIRSYDQPDIYSTNVEDYTKISGTGSAPNDIVGTRVSLKKRGYYSSSNVTDYKRRLARGELLPLNEYNRWDYVEHIGSGTYHGTNKGPNPKFSYRNLGPINGCDGVSMSSFQDAIALLFDLTKDVDLKALQLEAFADIQPDLDALTATVEVPKTLAMILGIRKRALSLLKQALTGGWASARAVSSAWLEWRYGWRTLGYDIEDFVDYWNRPLRNIILKGQAKSAVSTQETVTTSRGGYYCLYDSASSISTSVDVIVRAYSRTRGRTANRLISPVTTAWEVIPFSFVADWFVSVGDALSAWQVIANSEKCLSSVGYRLTEDCRTIPSNIRLGSGVNAMSPFGVDFVSTSHGSLLARRQLGAPNLFPQLRVKLTGKRIADAAALLVGFRKGLRI